MAYARHLGFQLVQCNYKFLVPLKILNLESGSRAGLSLFLGNASHCPQDLDLKFPKHGMSIQTCQMLLERRRRLQSRLPCILLVEGIGISMGPEFHARERLEDCDVLEVDVLKRRGMKVFRSIFSECLPVGISFWINGNREQDKRAELNNTSSILATDSYTVLVNYSEDAGYFVYFKSLTYSHLVFHGKKIESKAEELERKRGNRQGNTDYSRTTLNLTA
ncbi:2-oxoglutarate (2OG) and Fe(II)-dependent oxygenase superfamily protein [Striga asiatica]|uniref:2-oxoglutarate (2OG) and Fe(II)-dependent oxygenase superfamily protein n=1 Tax=Striga asiatica TaxID=4170 RepID=A0A5A7R8F4_STRAF|nr:2-oxoglutarate (2OG) and Fe(II)-dependent oxygenase superfamily protein [Striga asiatica]